MPAIALPLAKLLSKLCTAEIRFEKSFPYAQCWRRIGRRDAFQQSISQLPDPIRCLQSRCAKDPRDRSDQRYEASRLRRCPTGIAHQNVACWLSVLNATSIRPGALSVFESIVKQNPEQPAQRLKVAENVDETFGVQRNGERETALLRQRGGPIRRPLQQPLPDSGPIQRRFALPASARARVSIFSNSSAALATSSTMSSKACRLAASALGLRNRHFPDSPHKRKGPAQLMGCVGSELLNLIHRRLKTGKHGIAGLGQPLQLVPGVCDRQSLREIADADGSCRGRDSVHRFERPSAEPVAAGGRDEQAATAPRQEVPPKSAAEPGDFRLRCGRQQIDSLALQVELARQNPVGLVRRRTWRKASRGSIADGGPGKGLRGRMTAREKRENHRRGRSRRARRP